MYGVVRISLDETRQYTRTVNPLLASVSVGYALVPVPLQNVRNGGLQTSRVSGSVAAYAYM
jgi:hypothetical protein